MNTSTSTIHADQRFLKGLLDNDTVLIRDIYQRFAGKIKAYILKNNGNEEDAADIMQEALISIYRQAREGGLTLTCPFEAFLLLICKRKWLNELKKRGAVRVTNDLGNVSDTEAEGSNPAEQVLQQEERNSLFLSGFKDLGDRCKEIIRLSLNGKPQEENAVALGLTYGFFRKKKSECMATLMNFIRRRQTLLNT
jgi:RNA polymerase sigma factor (sigma-70 family)